jgi:hypothetical protein
MDGRPDLSFRTWKQGKKGKAPSIERAAPVPARPRFLLDIQLVKRGQLF